MKMFIEPDDIYLHTGHVDFRKSINGLAAIIESDTDLPLGSGALFLFTNKQRDKIKVLYWDKTGFALWYKRLENNKFKWPKKHELDTININEEQLHWLLRGFDINAMKAHNSIEFDSVY